MSSIKFDLHVICTDCRGKVCSSEDRCDLCVSWSDELMSNYVKHQKSLEGKRRAKKAKRQAGQEVDPMLSVCTGAVGSQPPEEIMDEGEVSSISSAGGSSGNIESYVESKLLEQSKEIDNKLDSFAINFASLIRQEMRSLLAEVPQAVAATSQSNAPKPEPERIIDHVLPNAVPNPSIPAPLVVPLQQDPLVQPSTLLGNPQRGDVHKEGDPLGRVQLGTLVSPPSPIFTCNTGKLPVSTSDQLVAALGSGEW